MKQGLATRIQGTLPGNFFTGQRKGTGIARHPFTGFRSPKKVKRKGNIGGRKGNIGRRKGNIGGRKGNIGRRKGKT